MNIASQLFGPSPNGKQAAQTNMINDAIAKQLDIIESKINRLAEDMALLLDERTRPAVPKKYPTEETVEIDIDPEHVNELANAMSFDIEKGAGSRRNRKPRLHLLQENVTKLGGEKIFKKKYQAGLVKLSICKFKSDAEYFRKRHVLARIDIVDSTLPRTKSGSEKKLGMECYTEREFMMLLEALSTILGTDFRSHQ